MLTRACPLIRYLDAVWVWRMLAAMDLGLKLLGLNQSIDLGHHVHHTPFLELKEQAGLCHFDGVPPH